MNGIIEYFHDLGSLLVLIHGVAMLGLKSSAVMAMSHAIHWRIAQRVERVEEPDPTQWKRRWERFFNRWFTPVGNSVTSEHRRPATNQMLFHFSITLAGTAVAMGLYVALSGMTLGALYAAYFSMGVAPDLSPLIRVFAAGIVLFALAVNFHAGEKAGNRVPAN